jgi:hypothetical protein
MIEGEVVKLLIDNGFATLSSAALFICLVWVVKKQAQVVDIQREQSQKNLEKMAEMSLQFAKSVDAITYEFHSFIENSSSKQAQILSNTEKIDNKTDFIINQANSIINLVKSKKTISKS